MNNSILETEQVKQINKLLLVVLVITSFFGVAGVLTQLTITEMAPYKSVVPAVLGVINLIISIVVYKASEPEFFHKYVAVGYLIVYAAMLLLSMSGTTFPYLIPIMIMTILYLDRTASLGLGIAFIVLNVIRVIINVTTMVLYDVIEISMISIIISILTMIATVLGTRLLIRFIGENMANVEEAAKERARVSENILNVTDQVTADFASLKSGLDEVGETSRLVCDSIDQIGQGNEENLSAVELQTNMTGEIQSLLNKADEITAEAVEVSGQMSDMLGKSLTDIESLVVQSTETTEVGNQGFG